MNISIPKALNQFAAICFGALKNDPAGKIIPLGESVGLLHYFESGVIKKFNP